MDAGTGGTPAPKVVNGNPYGSYVDISELCAALDSTRVLRLALNVLWDHLPSGIPHGPAQDVFTKIHDLLTEAEAGALAQCGFAEHYVVIRPFSPLSLPEEKTMKEITSAIRTLHRHGMLVQAPDALPRDPE